jgi:hypothetical protein
VTVTKDARHGLTKFFYCSDLIDIQEKKEWLAKLKAIDSSDKFDITEKYCEAAHPDLASKQKMWDLLMSEDGPKLPLYELEAACGGFRQITQRELYKNFAPKWFENIDRFVNSLDPSKSQSYFYSLRPNMEASQDEIKALEDFVKKVENKTEKGDGDERLKKWLGDTIQDLKEKNEARTMSKQWHD